MNFWTWWVFGTCVLAVVETYYYPVKRPPVSGMIGLTVAMFIHLAPRLLEDSRTFESKNHIGMALISLFIFTWRLMVYDSK